ncbi:hypothetical protein B9Z55_005537 [Caenorhabditis nigoni]|uniref:Uncharacterized protein n=1 Tax=Caenorhabditis nigoni TaxID=1611254 RepID=A0A2G5V1D0_9PELO|nr:hypothetical protein B9Z55_005537 [Caenorhabditis nigoni]
MFVPFISAAHSLTSLIRGGCPLDSSRHSSGQGYFVYYSFSTFSFSRIDHLICFQDANHQDSRSPNLRLPWKPNRRG